MALKLNYYLNPYTNTENYIVCRVWATDLCATGLGSKLRSFFLFFKINLLNSSKLDKNFKEISIN